jgi:hypothetical protein
MKRYSTKGLEKRKEERKAFPEFFQRHIQNIRDNGLCCEECGARLRGDVSEIAHVLPKSTFKSIATNDKNVLYLCGQWSNSQCHSNYDNYPTAKVKEMYIFSKVVEIFKVLEEEITEKITYKIEERYTWQV